MHMNNNIDTLHIDIMLYASSVVEPKKANLNL